MHHAKWRSWAFHLGFAASISVFRVSSVTPTPRQSRSSASISFFFLKTQQLQRLREEVASQQVKMANLEESRSQARKACDAWRCKALLAEQQRDEVIWIVWYFFSALVGPSFVFLFLLRITKGGSHFYVRCHRNVWKRSIEVFIWLKEINKTRMYYNHFMF